MAPPKAKKAQWMTDLPYDVFDLVGIAPTPDLQLDVVLKALKELSLQLHPDRRLRHSHSNKHALDHLAYPTQTTVNHARAQLSDLKKRSKGAQVWTEIKLFWELRSQSTWNPKAFSGKTSTAGILLPNPTYYPEEVRPANYMAMWRRSVDIPDPGPPGV
jgi:curved DNA-binding protein CbpA